jgi:ribonuclease R
MMSRKTAKKSKQVQGSKHIFTGKLEVTRSGMGYVIVEGQEQDIIVKRENLSTALNGDEVRVEIFPSRGGRRPEGRIIRCGDPQADRI